MYAATMEELLGLLEPQLVHDLTEPASLLRTRRLASRLPASISTFFGFERQLGLGAPTTDFAISLSAYGLDWVCSPVSWPQIGTLVSTWRAHFASHFHPVWLEFDTSRPASASRRVPNAFVAIDRRESGPIAPPGSVSSAIEIIYSDGGQSAGRASTIETCIDACPHVGHSAPARIHVRARDICSSDLRNAAEL